MDRQPHEAETMAALWRPSVAGARTGRRPGLSVDGLVAAAVTLADEEGLAAVSMARVAQRLGVTTMASYRYVAGKDELLARMYDAALAAPAELPSEGGWRDRLEAWCEAQLATIAAHPWVAALTSSGVVGPQRLRWLELGLAALDGTPLPVDVRVAAVGTLSLHVLTEGQLVAAWVAREAGRPGPQHPALLDYAALLGPVIDPAQHPRVAEALQRGAFDLGAEVPEVRGLTLLLDGVAALVARHESGG